MNITENNEDDDEMEIVTNPLSSAPVWAKDVTLWFPRVIGTIYLVSSTLMIYRAWNRRDHIFHRLVLVMAIHLFFVGAFFTYGRAAFPRETLADLGVDGHGSISTCDAQGFFLQFCFFSALSYYSLFSVYSYVSVLNNFRVQSFIWVEKYIHVLAHIYPFVASIISLATEGFNPKPFGICSWSSTNPPHCERAASNYAPCEHGSPENIYHMMFIIPEIFLLLFPTVVMGILYVKVRRNQSSIRLQAKAVASQACVYLLMLYWVTTPLMVAEIMGKKNKTHDSAERTEVVRIFIFIIMGNVQCFGLFSLLVYRYFTTGEYYRQDVLIGDGSSRKGIERSGSNRRVGGNSAETDPESYSFNIFDGTNAGGAFAEFIHEGDSEDEAEDAAETERWSHLQGL